MAGRPPVWVPPLSWPSYRRGASIGSGDLRRRTVSVPFLSASFFLLHLSRLHGGAGRPLSRLPPSRGAPQAPPSFSGEASSLHDSIAVSPVPASPVSCIHLSCALAVPAVHAGLQMSLPPLLCCRPLLVSVRIVVVGTLWAPSPDPQRQIQVFHWARFKRRTTAAICWIKGGQSRSRISRADSLLAENRKIHPKERGIGSERRSFHPPPRPGLPDGGDRNRR